LDVWLNLLKEDSETGAVDFVEDFKMNLYKRNYVPKGDIQCTKEHWILPLAYIQKGIKTRGTRKQEISSSKL
jgi:GTP pyrophosphokinase